jgi:hypothetical protein
MKGHYIVMDNAPIHTNENIKKYIEYRGYKCVYLPTYSPELNPIEQFWAVAKSKVKRHRFLQEDTLSKRITEACKSVEKGHFNGFVSHSYKCWDKCRNKMPMQWPISTSLKAKQLSHKNKVSNKHEAKKKKKKKKKGWQPTTHFSFRSIPPIYYLIGLCGGLCDGLCEFDWVMWWVM